MPSDSISAIKNSAFLSKGRNKFDNNRDIKSTDFLSGDEIVEIRSKGRIIKGFS